VSRPQPPKPFSPLCLVLAAASVIAGCAPSDHQRRADLQVARILDDAKRTTLSYQPQSAVQDGPTPDAPGTPVTKRPPTPISTLPGNQLEPIVRTAPHAALGPATQSSMPPIPAAAAVSDRRAGYDTPDARLGPTAPDLQPLRLDLWGVLRYALENSRDYRDQMEGLYLSTLDVTLERHLFEPTPFASQRFAYNGSANDDNSDFRSALAATTTAGVRQRLPYGGEIVAQGLVRFTNSFIDNVEDGETAEVALRATVPLLRGFGMVNLEGLIQSERQLIYDIRNFENYRRAFVVDVATQYFNLLANQSAVRNRRANLQSTIDVAERSQALFVAGKTSFVDVQRSLNTQINSESRLIQAEEQYEAQLDNFKVFLGMDVDTPLVIVPVEIELQVPRIDVNKAVSLAWQYRLDLQTRRDQIDDAQRRVNNAKNGLLPDLTFDATTLAGNALRDNTLGVDFNDQRYNAGVTLDLPLDRLRERNTYRRTLIFAQQAQRDFQQSRDSVAVAARNSIRRIRSAESRVELQRRNVQVAQARLDLARELLENPLNQAGGLTSSNRDVVEAQNQLLEAQDAFDQARAALQIQVLNFFRDTGTLRLDPAAGTLAQVLDRAELPPEITRQLPAKPSELDIFRNTTPAPRFSDQAEMPPSPAPETTPAPSTP
jgi:outer membrane protein TolC